MGGHRSRAVKGQQLCHKETGRPDVKSEVYHEGVGPRARDAPNTGFDKTSLSDFQMLPLGLCH